MISVAILTNNNEKTIERTLQSVKDFDEVIVLDSGSKDNTLKIVSSFPNTKVFHSSFLGFGKMRNEIASKAKNDWILALDSDEELSKEVVEELLDLKLDSNAIYSFEFFNFYNNKHIKCCGWHKEFHPRLYNKTKTNFSSDLVHEALILDNLKLIKLKHPINHFSYNSIEDFLAKMQFYSSLFAKQNIGKKSSTSKALFHGLFAFFKSYVIKRGFLGGKEGFIISIYNANTSFYKYLKLCELNKKNESNLSLSSNK
jgi:glycosyltransferase involved in cell wall biosynthesis